MKEKFKITPTNISPLYVIITALFVCFLMVANLSANRLVDAFGFVLTGDLFLFPITYIFGDILTEVYGYKRSRLVIWLGMIANVFMALYFTFILATPFPSDFVNQGAFATVLGTTPIIVFASILAYFFGEFANSTTLSVLKKVTKGRFLFLRTISSTLIGQLFDTLTFMLIVFATLVPSDVLWQMIILQYVFKVTYEILATPITYFVIKKVKQYEKLDTFDYGVKYNPLSLSLSENGKSRGK